MTQFAVKKKKKISKFAKPSTIDRISDLPDEILCHMLTFLPTKSALATSVLSKRWTSLYNSLTIINFDDESVKDHDDFLRFCHAVDVVTLSPHVQHQPIKKFHLKFSRFGDWHPEGANVHKWIEAAKQRGVEDISLYMNIGPLMPLRDEIIALENILFNSQNLVVLKLEYFHMSAEIFSVNLPSLKTLHLKMVFFKKCKDFKIFLSGCPVLEELQIKYLCLFNVGAGGFETSLSKLVRATISPFDIPFKAISNVEFLRILKMDEIDRKEKIYPYYKDFPIFCNLIHLEIQFWEYDHSWDHIEKVLQHSPKLQILLIKKRSSNYFTYRKDWENPNLVPECVSSHLKTCTIINYEGWNGDLQFATYILKNARFLRVMKIKVSRSLYYRKSQILAEISSRPRSSEGCKLLFEFQGWSSAYQGLKKIKK